MVSDPTHASLRLSACQASCPPSPGTATDQLKAARERPRGYFRSHSWLQGFVSASSTLGSQGREQGQGSAQRESSTRGQGKG